MRLTFLGTGAAGGVPRWGCACPACSRAHREPTCVRRPCSALIESDGTRVLIDAGLADLHERFAPDALDAILLTHFHPDHVQGLFHCRWGGGKPLNVHTPPDRGGCADLYKHPGMLRFLPHEKFATFVVGSIEITAVPLIHSKVTHGYVLESRTGTRIAYLTDTCGLPRKTLALLQQSSLDAVVLDCSHPPETSDRRTGVRHNDWIQARELAHASGARDTWFTHFDHTFDRWWIENPQPLQTGLHLAADGDCVEIEMTHRVQR